MASDHTQSRVLIRASERLLLVRFGDQWFRYDAWPDLFRDLKPTDRLRVQPLRHPDAREDITHPRIFASYVRPKH